MRYPPLHCYIAHTRVHMITVAPTCPVTYVYIIIEPHEVHGSNSTSEGYSYHSLFDHRLKASWELLHN